MKATSLNPRRSPSQQVSFMMTVKVWNDWGACHK
jgi:hypothetical protein